MITRLIGQIPFPRKVRRILRFAYRMPVYYHRHLSYEVCSDDSLGHGAVALNEQVRFHVPDHAVAASVFQDHVFERAGRKEAIEFLKLSEGCRSLVDLGASGGVVSVLFAASRPASDCRILSVEMDKPSLEVLEQTRSRNTHAHVEWVIHAGGGVQL